ncbi:MAG: glutaconyl-CoA decarboxylase subunit beta, partial [Synergistaceae bacterium]|nr:glutaconyl-CoA decarboxylase subunit beta [Synergistaceae bacterium]
MEMYLTALKDLIMQSGFFGLTTGNIIMLVVSFVLLYLAIV